MSAAARLEKYAERTICCPSTAWWNTCSSAARAELRAVPRVIHRDIKPANMLLTEDGDIKISDMAAVLLNLEQTQVSNIGSPSYMSPEQVRSEVLTHQTDIYSLGVVMYRLLTGARLTRRRTWPAVPPDTERISADAALHRPDIPQELERLVLRAMHKDQEQRYQN